MPRLPPRLAVGRIGKSATLGRFEGGWPGFETNTRISRPSDIPSWPARRAGVTITPIAPLPSVFANRNTGGTAPVWPWETQAAVAIARANAAVSPDDTAARRPARRRSGHSGRRSIASADELHSITAPRSSASSTAIWKDGTRSVDTEAAAAGAKSPAIEQNMAHVLANIGYYSKERVIQEMFEYAEVAEFARLLKQHGIDVDDIWKTRPSSRA